MTRRDLFGLIVLPFLPRMSGMPAFVGGRVEMVTGPTGATGVTGSASYYDISSAYPHRMTHGPRPHDA